MLLLSQKISTKNLFQNNTTHANLMSELEKYILKEEADGNQTQR